MTTHTTLQTGSPSQAPTWPLHTWKALLACTALLLALPAARAAGTLSFCIDASPEGFDVAQYETNGTFDAAGVPLYEQLTRIRNDDAQVLPGLAESWQISADGRVYTLQLRRGVKFHTTPWFKPTREMNADDVLWSFQRMIDKAHPGHAAARNGFVYWAGMDMNALVKSVEKVDAMTVRFTLTRPDAPFLASLGVPAVGPVLSAEYAARLQAAGKLEQLNIEPVGTGPFVLKSYKKDAVLRYTPHAGYWGGAPKLDSLVFAITPDAEVALQRLKAGECMVGDIKAESVPKLAGDPALAVVRSLPLATVYVAPNNQRPFTKDRSFREALWLAIDKAALIRGGYGGSATPAASFLPARMWGRDTALKDRHDPERARQLIKASGYDGRELFFFVLNDSLTRRRAESLQADWARVGLKVALRTMDLGEIYKRSGQGEHDLVLLSWISDNGDPDNFLSPNLACTAVAGGGNKARWCNPAFDTLLQQARASTDTAKRTALYQQAQRLVYDDVGLIPLVYPEAHTAVSKRVTGYVPNPLALHDFRNASVK
jgi:dipeptide transport system substrate-binding protein